MLDLRPSCECCDTDLPPGSPEARICSFECTFCADCVDGHLGGVCPGCGGGFVPRPVRPPAELARHPASTVRVVSQTPCPGRRQPTHPAPLLPVSRHPERALAQRDALDHLLDDVLAGTLSVSVDGRAVVVPILFARDGDRVIVHGSTGAGVLRHLAGGAPVVLCVFALDGLVVAHSTFESSANYRSAVLQGVAEVLGGDARTTALERFSDRLLPGRTGEVQPTTAKERAATLTLALPIADGQWVLKTRTGQADPPEGPTDAWCGVVPLHTVAGPLQPAPWTSPGTPVPASVRAVVDRRSMP